MGKRRGRGKSSRNTEDDRTDVIEKINMENSRFFAYYKAQKIVPDEEWDTFVDALRQHLPTTFRVAGSRQTANILNATIQNVHVPTLSHVIFEGQMIPPPVQIPWFPDGLAWQFNIPKKVLRKSPELKKFHSFLVFETEVGNLSRQEAVSMLPPLFLDVEPHHRVMDMCAAPGSKTAQILEALHAQDTITSTSVPSGLLLANDSDNKRTHLLIHQSARLPSPALMVTNLDASNFPSIKVPVQTTDGSSLLGPLLFDRILCDVPCSGDGTIRKNMGIWKSWQTMDANGLHGLQVRILLRAMKMLKHDGRIVYSTCSLNPVENEAVIAEALRINPEFELVDVSAKLPQLKRRPGLTTWRPTADRSAAVTFSTYEEFMSSSLDDASKAKMSEGHWPPKDIGTLNLPRCIRIYPHLQDSGGFFVAVLEKVRDPGHSAIVCERKRESNDIFELPESKKPRLSGAATDGQEDLTIPVVTGMKLEAKAEDSGKRQGKAQPKRTTDGGGSFKENPYTFLAPNDPILRTCIDRLHITSNFPASNVLIRNPVGEAVRSLYLVNDTVKAVIKNNDYNRIRLTSAGTKVFSKQESGKNVDPQFRVLGEGLPVILPFVDPRSIITADMMALRILLGTYYPLCSAFEEPFKSVICVLPLGSQIVQFSTSELFSHDVILPIWKSNMSLTLMIDKKAKSLRLFGSDITTAENMTLVTADQ
ncbi:S-adenosyl-L-methionine-dependent methyltransferase [Phlegmacium glaucopus]|nr:S-adenosyl-L-methionine-dependent methyltransferase [Phlegmacium glaucopus]